MEIIVTVTRVVGADDAEWIERTLRQRWPEARVTVVSGRAAPRVLTGGPTEYKATNSTPAPQFG